MLLFIDNFDSFSFILLDYLKKFEEEIEVVRNDINLESVEAENYTGLVVSPGPEAPKKAGNLIPLMEKFIGKKPLLGVCLGHQAIGEIYGARLEEAIEPVHGKTSLVKHQGHSIFSNVPNPFEVVRYHSLVLKEVPNTLEIIAESELGETMAISDKENDLVGLQFHPEAYLTKDGERILKNWLESI